MRTSPPSGSGLSAVADRILDQRHQHHRRKGQRLAAPPATSTRTVRRIAHPDLLHVQIRERQRQLVAERGVAAAHARQHCAEVARQVSSIASRGRRVGHEQPPHVGEGVEQEMRLDLRLHHLQARFGELALEFLVPHRFAVELRDGLLLAQQEEIAEHAGGDHVAPQHDRRYFLDQGRSVLHMRKQQRIERTDQEPAGDEPDNDRGGQRERAGYGARRCAVARHDHCHPDTAEEYEQVDIKEGDGGQRAAHRLVSQEHARHRMPKRGQREDGAENGEPLPGQAVEGPRDPRKGGRVLARMRRDAHQLVVPIGSSEPPLVGAAVLGTMIAAIVKAGDRAIVAAAGDAGVAVGRTGRGGDRTRWGRRQPGFATEGPTGAHRTNRARPATSRTRAQA